MSKASNPYLINVHDLMHKPGSMRRFDEDILAPEALGTEVCGVPAGATLELETRIESVHEGILVTGTVFTDGNAVCSRCLEPLSLDVEVDFQELFAYSVDNEDDFAVTDEQINLEQVIRDAVVLSLPFQPVCSNDCLGLCPTCGVKMADNPQHQHDAPIDSRWNALASFKED